MHRIATLIDSYFDNAAYEVELTRSARRLCAAEGRAAGCRDRGGGRRLRGAQAAGRRAMRDEAAVRRFRARTERGAGGALARAIVERGRGLGYSRMMLDTGPKQVEAQKLVSEARITRRRRHITKCRRNCAIGWCSWSSTSPPEALRLATSPLKRMRSPLRPKAISQSRGQQSASRPWFACPHHRPLCWRRARSFPCRRSPRAAPTKMPSPRPRTRSASASGAKASAFTMPTMPAAFRRARPAICASTAFITRRSWACPA